MRILIDTIYVVLSHDIRDDIRIQSYVFSSNRRSCLHLSLRLRVLFV